MASNNSSVFQKPERTPRRGEIRIFVRPILPRDSYQGASPEEREQEILGHWNLFLNEDLPRIEAALKKEPWIWESVETDDLPDQTAD